MAHRGRLLPISDPWRRPFAAIRSVLSGAVGVPDGLRIAYLRSQALAGVRNGKIDPIAISNDKEKTTREELISRGFSSDFIRLFFEPFFGGVFLERNLTTASQVFEFTFAMFYLGSACLPAGGMSAIPRQMVQKLPLCCLETLAPVGCCFSSCSSKHTAFARRPSHGMDASVMERYLPCGF